MHFQNDRTLGSVNSMPVEFENVALFQQLDLVTDHYVSNSLQEYLWNLLIGYWISLYSLVWGASVSIAFHFPTCLLFSLVAMMSDSEGYIKGIKEKVTPENM